MRYSKLAGTSSDGGDVRFTTGVARGCSRMRGRRVAMVVAMILLGVVYLMTYGGQGIGVTHAAFFSVSSSLLSTAPDSVVNPHPFNYLLNKPDLCDTRLEMDIAMDINDTDEDDRSAPDLDMVIMVVTAPTNFATRMAIRRTWGSVVLQHSAYRLAFVMGQPQNASVQDMVIEEDGEYDDIVQEDFLDTYQNLTLKSVMILKWVESYCRNSRYVLKIDDDCFLNPKSLQSFLGGRKETKAIFGRVWQKVKPIRDVKDKWHVTKEEFSGDVYPDYTGGPTYVLTTAAVSELYAASLQLRPIVLEDVFVTGMCADRAKVPRVSDLKFGVADPPNACSSRTVHTYHRVSPDAMYLLWWLINDSKFDNLCSNSSKDSQCNKVSSTFVDLTNVIIKNTHG